MIGSILNIATGFLDRRHERSQAKHEAQVEQIRAGSNERAQGWKDELALVVLVAPFIACFIPGAQDYVTAGFETLKNSTPDWYQYLFTGGMVAALGIQGWGKFRK